MLCGVVCACVLCRVVFAKAVRLSLHTLSRQRIEREHRRDSRPSVRTLKWQIAHGELSKDLLAAASVEQISKHHSAAARL